LNLNKRFLHEAQFPVQRPLLPSWLMTVRVDTLFPGASSSNSPDFMLGKHHACAYWQKCQLRSVLKNKKCVEKQKRSGVLLRGKNKSAY
jgi:hypothetical protein